MCDNVLMKTIKEACNDACLDMYDITVKEVVIDTDIKYNNKEYQVSICIQATENGKYLISESDIEIPSNKKIIIDSYVKNFIIIESIHDWSDELGSMHYHIVSTRACNLKMLKFLLKYILTIHFHLYNNTTV